MSSIVNSRWQQALTVVVSGGAYAPGEPNGVELPKGVDLAGVLAEAAPAVVNDGFALALEIKMDGTDSSTGFAPLINGGSGNITTQTNTQFPGVSASGLVSLAAGCRIRLNGASVGAAAPADQTITAQICANYAA